MNRIVARWSHIGEATGRVNSPDAAAAIDRVYHAAGLAPPGRYLWLSSPCERPSAVRCHPSLIAHPVADSIMRERASLRQAIEQSAVFLPSYRRLEERIDGMVRQAIFTALVGSSASVADRAVLWGQHEAPWIALGMWARACRPEALTARQHAALDAWAATARHCGWWWPYRNICIVADRPAFIHWESQGPDARLHNDTGPAIGFRDGWDIYLLQGVPVDGRIVTGAIPLTVSDIHGERDADRRRVLMDHYGVERFLRDAGAEEIHADRYGVLYRCRVHRGEDVVVVKVRNSTPEPDGSYKSYLLRVAPWLQTAHRAVAWTFGLDDLQYQPLVET